MEGLATEYSTYFLDFGYKPTVISSIQTLGCPYKNPFFAVEHYF
jgi:hypothetical protein